MSSEDVYADDDPIVDLDGNIIVELGQSEPEPSDAEEDVWSESEQSSYTYDEEDKEDYCPSSSSSSEEWKRGPKIKTIVDWFQYNAKVFLSSRQYDEQ